MFDIVSHLAGKTETELKPVMVKAVRCDPVLVSAGIVCSVLTASMSPPLGPWEITSHTVTKRQAETRAARREAETAFVEKTFVPLKEIGCLKRKHATLETRTPAHTYISATTPSRWAQRSSQLHDIFLCQEQNSLQRMLCSHTKSFFCYIDLEWFAIAIFQKGGDPSASSNSWCI